MTAKEKAIEVIKKFRAELLFETFPDSLDTLSKECAIIHVKGIIEVLDSIPTTRDHFNKTVHLEQVLDELNKM